MMIWPQQWKLLEDPAAWPDYIIITTTTTTERLKLNDTTMPIFGWPRGPGPGMEKPRGTQHTAAGEVPDPEFQMDHTPAHTPRESQCSCRIESRSGGLKLQISLYTEIFLDLAFLFYLSINISRRVQKINLVNYK